MKSAGRFAIWAPAILILVPLAAAQTYTITDLGTFPGGSVSQGQAIDWKGQVAGYARFANYNAHGFIWSSSGGLKNLPPIGPPSNFAVATALNSVGEVVGYSTYDELENEHAVLWVGSELQDLGTLPGGTISEATGINDSGEITGFSNSGIGEPHAFLWTPANGMEDLGTLPGGYYSQGLAINASGQIAGYSNDGSGNFSAFKWSSATGMVQLGSDKGNDSGGSANAINDIGQVVGGADYKAGQFATLWNPDNSVISLGALPGEGWSSAFAINNQGDIVGWSGFTAFIWTRDNGMQDLNTLIPANSGWTLNAAYGINVKGQITGQGVINGESHGFLLTPVAAK